MTQTGPVLIFGGEGYLARHFRRYFSERSGQVVLAKTDVTQLKDVEKMMDLVKPAVVINAAGKTHGWGKPNISGCEVSEEAKRQTWLVNTLAAAIVADACVKYGTYLVHISTGSIFQGDNEGKGFSEISTPTPTSWYAQTKVQGDGLVESRKVGVVLRIQMPVSADEHPRNLITKLVGFGTVMDLKNSITVVPDLLSVVEQMFEKQPTGIFNVVNPSPASHAEIVSWYCDIVDPKHRVAYQVVPGTVERCVLATDKLESIGIHLPCAEQAIKDCLRRYPTPLV